MVIKSSSLYPHPHPAGGHLRWLEFTDDRAFKGASASARTAYAAIMPSPYGRGPALDSGQVARADTVRRVSKDAAAPSSRPSEFGLTGSQRACGLPLVGST